MHQKVEYSLCRLCLCEGDCLIDIFVENNKLEFRLDKAIEDLLQLKVEKETAYPWLICSNCLNKVSVFRIFKLRCVESQVVFYNRFKRSRVEEEESESEPENKRTKREDEDCMWADDDATAANAQGGTGAGDGPPLCERANAMQAGYTMVETTVHSNLNTDEETECITPDDCGVQPMIMYDFEGQEFRVHIKEEVEDVDDSDGPVEREDAGSGGETTSDHERLIKEEYHIEEPEVLIKEEVEDADDSDGPMERKNAGGGGETTSDHGLLKEEFHIEEPEVMLEIGERLHPEEELKPAQSQVVSPEGNLQVTDVVNDGNPVGHTGDSTETPEEKQKSMTFNIRSVATTSNNLENIWRAFGDHHKEKLKPFKCRLCNERFPRLAPLKKHMSSEHIGVKIVSETEKTEVSPVEVKGHAKEGSESPLTCKICWKTFTKERNLRRHVVVHDEGLKKHVCTVCGKNFHVKGSLMSHMNVHTGEKPYECEVCGNSFSHMSTLIRHMMVHTGEKPHVCTFCPKAFTTRRLLLNHLATHTGEKPYSCTLCSKSFTTKTNLDYHEWTHKGEKPHKCPHCPKAFMRKERLTNHIHTHKEK